MRSAIALLLITLQLAPVYAADCPRQDYSNPKTEPDYNCPGPGEESMVPRLQMQSSVELLKGKPAPWDGVLLDRNRVLTLGLQVKALRRLRYIDGLGYVQKMEAEVKFAQESCRADLKLRTSQRNEYRVQLKRANKQLAEANKWYRSWSFGLVVGILVTATGAVAVAYASK